MKLEKAPVKILVISDYRLEHTIRPEAEILISLAKQGFDLTVMTYPESSYVEPFRKAGIRVIGFHPDKKLNRKEISFVRQELLKEDYDILYLVNNNEAISTGLQAARGLPVKVVLYRGYAGNLDWYDPTSWIKHLNPRADKIICNARGVEEYLHRQLFFDKSKTITINKGHKLEWYQNVKPVEKSALGLPENAFIVTTAIKNRQRMKGMPYLLKATYYWPTDLPIHLLLVGKNIDIKENLELAAKSPNKDKIHFMGYYPDPLGIIAASDIAILASVKGEAITRFILESMSLGIAPVITDVSGNEELVVQGETGIVVPMRDPKALADAVLKLYQDRDLLAKFRKGSRDRIANVLSHQNAVEQMAALFRDLAARKRAATAHTLT